MPVSGVEITPEQLAEHLAMNLDGDYSDGLEVSVAATARGSEIELELIGGFEESAKFRLLIMEVPR